MRRETRTLGRTSSDTNTRTHIPCTGVRLYVARRVRHVCSPRRRTKVRVSSESCACVCVCETSMYAVVVACWHRIIIVIIHNLHASAIHMLDSKHFMQIPRRTCVRRWSVSGPRNHGVCTPLCVHNVASHVGRVTTDNKHTCEYKPPICV